MLQLVAISLYNAAMARSESWPAVLTVAEEQWGLVTKQQVDATGAAWSTLARQARNGALEHMAHAETQASRGGRQAGVGRQPAAHRARPCRAF